MGTPKITRWINYNHSFNPRSDKVSLVTGALAKLKYLCPSQTELTIATLQISVELHSKRYPRGIILEAISKRMQKDKHTWNRVYKVVKNHTKDWKEEHQRNKNNHSGNTGPRRGEITA